MARGSGGAVSDHDGHTINVGPVTIGEPLPKAVADPIDTDAVRRIVASGPRPSYADTIDQLCGEVDRLRAENDRLRAVVLAGQEARAVEQDEPFDHEHAEAAWAAYDVAVERLEADRG